MRFNVEVRAEHIDQRLVWNPLECMIARALNEATGYRWHAGVTTCCLSEGGRPLINLPEDASAAIVRLGTGGTVQPFSFIIDLPDGYLDGAVPSEVRSYGA